MVSQNSSDSAAVIVTLLSVIHCRIHYLICFFIRIDRLIPYFGTALVYRVGHFQLKVHSLQNKNVASIYLILTFCNSARRPLLSESSYCSAGFPVSRVKSCSPFSEGYIPPTAALVWRDFC